MSAREHDGTSGWRAGIEASLRRLRAMQSMARDLYHPAFFAALDELEIKLLAMIERGSERSTTEVVQAAPPPPRFGGAPVSARYIDLVFPLEGYVLLESQCDDDDEAMRCSVLRIGPSSRPRFAQNGRLDIGDTVLCPRSAARLVGRDNSLDPVFYFIARADDLIAFVRPEERP